MGKNNRILLDLIIFLLVIFIVFTSDNVVAVDNVNLTDGIITYFSFNNTYNSTYPTAGYLTKVNGTVDKTRTGKIGEMVNNSNVTTSWLTLSTSSATNLSFERTENFSFSFWINPRDCSAGGVLGKLLLDSPYTGYGIRFYSCKISLDLYNNYFNNRLIVTSDTALVQDKWTMVTVTYNGTSASGGVKIYYNGTEQAKTAQAEGLSGTIVNTNKLSILGMQAVGDARLGIDELKIYNKELTQAQVNAIWMNETAGVSFPYTESGIGEPCIESWSCSGYASCNTNGLIVCNETTDSNSCGTEYTGDYSEFETIYCGVMAYFSFNNTYNSTTPVGYYNATVVGNVEKTQTCKIGQCINSSDSSSYLDYKNNSFIFEKNDEFSFSFWVNPSNCSSGGLLGRLDLEDPYPGYMIRWYDCNPSLDVMSSYWNNKFQRGTNNSLPLNTWTMVTITYNGTFNSTGVQIYFNATKQNLTNRGDYDYVSGDISSEDSNFTILGIPAIGSSAMVKLDELKIYKKELTEDQILSIYLNESSGYSYPYYSPCINNLTNTTASEWINQSICNPTGKQLQNRSYVVFDANVCGNYTNTTVWEYQNISCSYYGGMLAYFSFNNTYNSTYPLNKYIGTPNETVYKTNNGVIGQMINSSSIGYGLNLTSYGSSNFSFERTDKFSFSFWVKPTDCSAGGVLGKVLDGSPYTGYGIRFYSCKISLDLYNNYANNKIIATSDVALTTDVWTMVTVTYNGTSDGSQVKIYYNATPQTITVVENTLTGSILNNQHFEVLNMQAVGATTIAIDELKVYDKELNQVDVTGIYGNETAGIAYPYNVTSSPPVLPSEVPTSCFGDSITQGFIIGAEDTYCALMDATSEFSTTNNGVGGNRLSDLISRINSSKGFNTTVLLIGANDAANYLDNQTFYTQYVNISKAILNDNQKMVISTLSPCSYAFCVNISQYNNIIRYITYNLSLIYPGKVCYADIYSDAFGGNYSAGDFEDEIHPNEEAHKKMNSTYINAFNSCSAFDCTTQPEQCYTYVNPCVNNLQNTTASVWVNQSDCKVDNTQLQNRSYVVFDANVCGNYTNTTVWEYQNISCAYPSNPFYTGFSNNASSSTKYLSRVSWNINISDGQRLYNWSFSENSTGNWIRLNYSNIFINTTNMTMCLDFEGNSINKCGNEVGVEYGIENTTGKIGGAYNFSANDHINISSSVLQSSVFTISWWEYILPETPKSVDWGYIVCDSKNISNLLIRHYNVTGTMVYVMYVGKTQLTFNASLPATYGNWTFMTVTFNSSGKVVFYKNGVTIGSSTNSDSDFKGITTNLMIGNKNGLDRDFEGKLDMMTIYQKVLPVSEIAKLYNDGKGYQYGFNTTEITQVSIVNATRGVNVCGKFTFYDNNTNFNDSSLSCFVVNNTIPSINISISPIPVSISNKMNLTMSFYDVDGDVASLNETIWYLNNVSQTALLNKTIIGSGNLSSGQHWKVSARTKDGQDWSSWANSSEIVLNDTDSPNIYSTYVSSLTPYSDETLTISINCSDLTSPIGSAKFQLEYLSNKENRTLSHTTGDVWSYTSTFGTGTYNITHFYCWDTSNYYTKDNTSYLVEVTSRPTPGGTTGGGGGTPTTQIVFYGDVNATYFDIKTETGSEKYELLLRENEVREKNIQVYNLYEKNIIIDLSCYGDLCDKIVIENQTVSLEKKTVENIKISINTSSLEQGITYFFGIKGVLKDINGTLITSAQAIGEQKVEVFATITPLSYIRVWTEKFISSYLIFGIEFPKIIIYLLISFIMTIFIISISKKKQERLVYGTISFILTFVLSTLLDDLLLSLI